MPRVKKEKVEGIAEKLEYIGLDLENIPENFQNFEPLEFRVSRFYEDKKYRQYRYIPVKDIQILLSPTNRLDDLQEKYKKARPLYEYLDNEKEENLLKYTTFLNMLKNVNIEDIKRVEKEQNNLNKEIPFKVKYQGNYLWQIYYSENTDKYFMIVPTEDTDYSTFFYLLKKQIENKRTSKIFVPVSNVKYTNTYLKKAEFEDLENYLWLFTKDWPSIYEVFDKKENLTIKIIGETNVYEKIKTSYKIELKTLKEANEFYKLVKVLFILQSELPHYYNFLTNINDEGSLEFYLKDQKIEYKYLTSFIREQYKLGLKNKKEIKSKIRAYKKRLEELKQISVMQEMEYLAKEKQISTFLECKKSFFGKVKYFFKYSKKNTKNKKEVNQEVEEKDTEVINQIAQVKTESTTSKKKIPIKKVYTLEELVTSYKELEELENRMKNLLMDINALKLKNKNMEKKIENATKFIEEIDSHKKSIFEFWKYSNKDEIDVLPEGEQEEVNIIKKIEKTFDYEEDIEAFGKKLDRMQRKNLSKEETDNIYIATTNLIQVLNKIKTNNVGPEDIEKSLKEMKKEAQEEKALLEDEYDIFGNLVEDNTKIRKINNKKHRELPKDKFNILDITRNTKQIGYKLTLQAVIQNILKSLEKSVIPDSLPIYKAVIDEKLDNKKINVFNINPENEMKKAINEDGNKINLYKINIKEKTNGIGFTNIIFYDNQNKTLPVGMDLSTEMIIDTSKLHLNLVYKNSFKVIEFEDEKDDFSDIKIKNVDVYEYDVVTFDEE